MIANIILQQASVVSHRNREYYIQVVTRGIGQPTQTHNPETPTQLTLPYTKNQTTARVFLTPTIKSPPSSLLSQPLHLG